MFFIIALSVLILMHGYVAWRIIPSLNLSISQSILAYSLVFAFSIIPLLPIILRINGHESKHADRLSFLGYTSLGFFTLSFIALLTKDFLYQIISIIIGFINSDQVFDNSKREFLKESIFGVSILGLTGVASVYGFYNSRKSPTVIEQDIYLNGLPLEFENFTIAQISDLHVGPTIKRPYVESVLNKISRINPNLIAVTGDLVDGSVKYLRKELEPFKDMIAEYGTYFVTGNHEYYSGVDSWLDETDHLGMTNLINTNQIISKSTNQIAIAGITDFRAHKIKSNHKSNPKLALQHLSKDMTKIVLAHQPNSIHSVHRVGADLQLSGHTHGGQFWPFTYPTKLFNIYLAGLYDHFGTQIYVNRGTGYWGPPLRIGVPAEITLIRLKRKPLI